MDRRSHQPRGEGPYLFGGYEVPWAHGRISSGNVIRTAGPMPSTGTQVEWAALSRSWDLCSLFNQRHTIREAQAALERDRGDNERPMEKAKHSRALRLEIVAITSPSNLKTLAHMEWAVMHSLRSYDMSIGP